MITFLKDVLSEQTRFRIRIWQALRSGPPFRSDMDRIIIDLTHFCDLSCTDCNRSCGGDQAPATETISLEQIQRFIDESIKTDKHWRRIWLEGGEPTLHPQLDEVLEILLHYKQKHNRQCEILLCTNGHGEKARQVTQHLPEGIGIKNSAKSPQLKSDHFTFNVAPADLADFSKADYSDSCYIHRIFGVGLNCYGYYPHPICGGIDRVFGYDVGLKHLPKTSAEMTGQMQRLCRLCGHFREFYPVEGRKRHPWRRVENNFPEGSRSKSWVEAYNTFKRKPPVLTRY